ncbi:inositol monophosphatase [Bipolaris maydis]|nr:inositol monophosphatase [Bipolaris maydis]
MDINRSNFSCGDRLQPSPQTAFQSHCLSPANTHTQIRRFSNSAANRLSPTSTISTPAPQRTPISKMASIASQDFKLALSKHGLTADHLNKIHDLLVDIAIDSGKIMVAAEHSVLVAAQYKNNTSDLVTEFDKRIEDTVETRLRDAYPAFGFLGEETFKHGTKLADKPTFVCDPIDGTLNFSKGVPNCAISLALTLEKKPIIGVVYNPFRGDLYHAVKGQGAYLKNMLTGTEVKLPMQPVPPPMPSLNSCLVAIEWGNQRSGENWALRTSVHNKLLTSKAEGGAMCKSVRSNGSAALDFCYVAQGIIDVFWEGGVWIWDVCAGWIILEEAGGIVASANPDDWDPSLEGRVYFAVRHAKPEEQKAVVEELWGIMGDRKFVF